MTMPKDVQYALNGMYSYATSNPDFDELSVDTITRYIAAQDAEIERLRKDAGRYCRIRENWIDCGELCLHGRLAVIDTVIDRAMRSANGTEDGE